VADDLRAAVDYANEVILDNVPRGGTTLVAALVIGDVAYVVYVGDSRAYLITKDEIHQITRDHFQAWEDPQKELVKFFPAENPTSCGWRSLRESSSRTIQGLM
jgi:serine/threonine protein phosphatase PrpC